MPLSSDAEILLRRSEVARLYLLGWYQSRIAVHFGVTQQTISNDLAAIRKEWQESMLEDFNEAKAKELAKIDHLESVYWDAWDKSCKPRTQKRKKYMGKVDKKQPGDKQQISAFDTTDVTIERDGNPRFLDGVMDCIQKRVAIMGLDAPQKIKLTEDKLPDWLRAARPNLN